MDAARHSCSELASLLVALAFAGVALDDALYFVNVCHSSGDAERLVCLGAYLINKACPTRSKLHDTCSNPWHGSDACAPHAPHALAGVQVL